MNPSITVSEINAHLEQVAAATGAQFIDLEAGFARAAARDWSTGSVGARRR